MNKITSRDNETVKLICKLRDDRKERHARGLFICEGEVMLREALKSDAVPHMVFITEGTILPAGVPDSAEIYEVSPHVMEKMSDVKSNRGLLFTCAMPSEASAPLGDRVLCLENIQDPGNLGTAVRTAEAFGIDTVVLMGACADLYSPKSIRATMGSVFRQRVIPLQGEELFARCALEGLPVYSAELNEHAKSIRALDLRRCCVIIGNEGQGVTPETSAKCAGSVIIPIKGAESLNASAAAVIIMYEMARD